MSLLRFNPGSMCRSNAGLWAVIANGESAVAEDVQASHGWNQHDDFFEECVHNTFQVATYALDKVISITCNGVAYVQSDFITGIETPVGVEIDGNNLYVSSFAN